MHFSAILKFLFFFFPAVVFSYLETASELGLHVLFLQERFPTESDGFKLLWDLQQGFASSLRQKEKGIKATQQADAGKQQEGIWTERFLWEQMGE